MATQKYENDKLAIVDATPSDNNTSISNTPTEDKSNIFSRSGCKVAFDVMVFGRAAGRVVLETLFASLVCVVLERYHQYHAHSENYNMEHLYIPQALALLTGIFAVYIPQLRKMFLDVMMCTRIAATENSTSGDQAKECEVIDEGKLPQGANSTLKVAAPADKTPAINDNIFSFSGNVLIFDFQALYRARACILAAIFLFALGLIANAIFSPGVRVSVWSIGMVAAVSFLPGGRDDTLVPELGDEDWELL